MHILPNTSQCIVNNETSYLTGSRDAPHVSTLPPDVTLLAVEKAIPLLQELRKQTLELQLTIICNLSSDYFLDHLISCLVYKNI